jgi:hypothetical protein
VCPTCGSTALTCAPASSSARTASALSERTAAIRTVSPVMSVTVRIRAGHEEATDHGRVALSGRDVERRDAVTTGGFDVGARANQRLGCREIIGADGPVQRSRPVDSGTIHVGARLEQPLDGLQRPLARAARTSGGSSAAAAPGASAATRTTATMNFIGITLAATTI